MGHMFFGPWHEKLSHKIKKLSLGQKIIPCTKKLSPGTKDCPSTLNFSSLWHKHLSHVVNHINWSCDYKLTKLLWLCQIWNLGVAKESVLIYFVLFGRAWTVTWHTCIASLLSEQRHQTWPNNKKYIMTNYFVTSPSSRLECSLVSLS